MLPHLAPSARTGRTRRSPHRINQRTRRGRARRPATYHASRATFVLALTVATIGCTGVPAALGSDPQTARTNADALFDGLAKRFDNVQRTPKFFQARSKLGRYALSPSGVFRDTSVWTAIGADSTRTLTLSGSHNGTGYVFSARAGTPMPSVTGDSRHIIRLARRGDSEYRWDTAVDHAIGPVDPDDVARALTAFISSDPAHVKKTIDGL